MNVIKLMVDHSAKLLAAGVVSSMISLGVIMIDANDTLKQLSASVASIEASSYNTEFLELKYELAGVPDSDIIPTIQYWRDDQKGGKLGALSTLCSQRPQILMTELVGSRNVSAACRYTAI